MRWVFFGDEFRPAANLPNKRWKYVLPNNTESQKMIGGNAKKVIARLQPNSIDSMPQMNVPHIEPMLLMEPTISGEP